MIRKKKIHDNWVTQYQNQRPRYDRLSLKLKSLLEDLLSSSAINYHVIESRAKTIASFTEKLQREGRRYSAPLSEITDLAGIRVILYYVDDVDRVSNMVEREFIVDPSKSVDKGAGLAPDQFGYLSVHKIVKISDSRARLPEWMELSDLTAEIQIRTVLQHSWAAISHALQYKHEADVPYEFRRSLIRLSGLLEIADDGFSTLRKQQTLLRKNIAEKVSEGKLDLAVDSISITEFVTKSDIAEYLDATARNAGFSIVNSTNSQGISQLVQACQIVSVKTIKDLELRLTAAKPWMLRFFTEFLKTRLDQGDHKRKISASSAHLAALVLIAAHRKPLSKEDLSGFWSPEYSTALLQTRKKLQVEKPG